MSLVAYAASSDEDSDCERSDESSTVPVKATQHSSLTEHQQNVHQQQEQPNKSLKLPQPKNAINDDETTDDFTIKLPAPKQSQANIVKEEDDEFLYKKVQPSLVEKPTKPKTGARQPVKITIPSLAELRSADDDDVILNGKPFKTGPTAKKPSGLLNVLPPPKFNGTFGKPKERQDSPTTEKPVTKTTSLIPHAVSKKQAAAKLKPMPEKKPSLGLNYNNSDDSDNEDDAAGDFFSLNSEIKLPEVSSAEIDAMVAKKANRMAEFARNLNDTESKPDTNEYTEPSTSNYVTDTEHVNIEALIGARAAKRSRKNDIQFIDISQDQVTSSHDEWKRNHLQSETEYQPTGNLNVGDPGAGTKRKHQITYLAYQAKANEAELQAMWATNRQSRRQTQSKYGF